jgi:hypothetical protein
MVIRRTDASMHTLLAIDTDRRVVEDLPAVPTAEVAPRITALLSLHGATIRILVDGVAIDVQAMTRAAASAAASRAPPRPPVVLADHEEEAQPGIELGHVMLWDSFDRAARIHSWMLEQASSFTLDLLNNHKRLADQASEMQKRYQAALAEVDYMHREQKLMEGEAAASRLSRHLIEKARAEIAAANPTKPSDWIDDLIDGAAVALGALNGTRGPKDSN